MPINAEWGDSDKSYIVVTFAKEWTVEEFYLVNAEQVPAMMRTVSHKVNVISDYTKTTSLRMSNAISHAKNVGERLPANNGKAIIVSTSVFIHSMVGIFKTIFKGGLGDNIMLVRTMAEAYEALAIISQKQASEAAPAQASS